MISTIQHHRATANPSEHRASPRWCIQDGLSQIAQSTADNTLGLLVDIGIGGFQISLLQPLQSVESHDLLLILDRFPNAPQTIPVKATPTWLDETPTAGIGYAGFNVSSG